MRSQRGSVLVTGLFMGVILVLVCLHMIGVCEAILVRALGQNIADAIALEGAVWHAQGMNIIVLINLIMAAVLALFITIRLVEIVLITIIAVLTVAAALAEIFSFGGGTTLLRWIERFAERLGEVHKIEDRVSEPIMKTLAYGADAERLVAAVMPYVSLARPVTRSADLPGLVVGISLVPAVLEQKLSKAPQIPIVGDDGKVKVFGTEWQPELSFPARMGTLPLGPALTKQVKKLDGDVAKKGARKGLVVEAVDLAKGVFGSLPVQEEDSYQLCGRAGAMVTTFWPSVFGMNDEALAKVGSFTGVVFGSLQTMTCTPLKDVSNMALNELRKAADKKCQDEEDADIYAGIPTMMGEPEKEHWTKKQREKCRKDELEKAKKASGFEKNSTTLESVKVARLWGIMLNPKESPFLHVWSFVPLDRSAPTSRFQRDMKNLFRWDLDDVGVTGFDVSDPDSIEPADAMAEFRHVCNGKNDPAGRGCGENSMWRPGWFAKLVPVRDFSEEIKQKYGEILAGWFSRALGKAIASSTDKVLNKFIPKVSAPFRDVLERHVGAVLGQRMLNNWFVRRYLTGAITKVLKIKDLEALTVMDYPEHLH